MMLGVTSKRQRVLNLWKGFHADTTEALWVQKLNPDISSWKKIVRVAQRLEVYSTNGSSGSGGHDKGKNRPCSSNQNRNMNYHAGGQNTHFSKEKQEFKPSKSNLSEQDRKKFIAEGRCFKCGEIGHLSRNCQVGTLILL